MWAKGGVPPEGRLSTHWGPGRRQKPGRRQASSRNSLPALNAAAVVQAMQTVQRVLGKRDCVFFGRLQGRSAGVRCCAHLRWPTPVRPAPDSRVKGKDFQIFGENAQGWGECPSELSARQRHVRCRRIVLSKEKISRLLRENVCKVGGIDDGMARAAVMDWGENVVGILRRDKFSPFLQKSAGRTRQGSSRKLWGFGGDYLPRCLSCLSCLFCLSAFSAFYSARGAWVRRSSSWWAISGVRPWLRAMASRFSTASQSRR